MDEQPDLAARVSALEAWTAAAGVDIATAVSDAAAARHLAAARDRDLADLGIKVDANRVVINAVGEQLSGRITGLDERVTALTARVDHGFAEVDRGFAEVDRRFAEVDRRFAEVDRRFGEINNAFGEINNAFGEVDRGFAEVRGRLDAAAAGQQTIVDLLTRLIDEPGPTA